MENDFNVWLDKRTNVVNEFLGWPWFNKKKKTSDFPVEPSQIYNNPVVAKYTNEVLKTLGLQSGAEIEVIDNNYQKVGDTIQITNWSAVDNDFYEALQRFVAAHVLGRGSEKSFLQINYHDAAYIVNKLDNIRRVGDRAPIAEKFHINNPVDLSRWMQSKVPVDPSAIAQQGFGQDSNQFKSERLAKGADAATKSKPFRDVVEKGQRVIVSASKSGKGSRTELYKNLKDLKASIEKWTHADLPEIDTAQKNIPTPPPGTIVGRSG